LIGTEFHPVLTAIEPVMEIRQKFAEEDDATLSMKPDTAPKVCALHNRYKAIALLIL
jgi:hypothetical protein